MPEDQVAGLWDKKNNSVITPVPLSIGRWKEESQSRVSCRDVAGNLLHEFFVHLKI